MNDVGMDVRRLRLLLEVNNALVSNRETRSLFGAISDCLRRVVSHEYLSLAVYVPERGALDMWALDFAEKNAYRDSIDFGTAFQAAYQDPTLTSTIPGAAAVPCLTGAEALLPSWVVEEALAAWVPLSQ